MKINIYGEKRASEWVQETPEYLTISDQYGKIIRLDRGSNDAKISNNIRYTRFKAGHPAGFIEAFANYYEDISENLRCFLMNEKNKLNDECFGIEESKEGILLFTAISDSSISKKFVNINDYYD